MIISIVREQAGTENRVGLVPSGVAALAANGHRVLVESGAGEAARFPDEEYRSAGATVLYDREELFGRADLLIKVASLDARDVGRLRHGQCVLAFHHLATATRGFVEAVLATEATLIGYEVVEDARDELPILHAMSEIAGQLSVHVAAHFLQTRGAGRGVLLGGSTGIPPAHVVILGAGVVGRWAARTAGGNRAQVTLLDANLAALRYAEEALGATVVTEMAHPQAVERAVAYADAFIGAVLLRGERAPMVVRREWVDRMKPGAVIVDVSIDQGGCVETSRPTTLAEPTYVLSGITHYAVPNMPAVVARTASIALSHAALPSILTLAEHGVDPALADHPELAAGVYVFRGELVSEGVSRACGVPSARLKTHLPAAWAKGPGAR